MDQASLGLSGSSTNHVSSGTHHRQDAAYGNPNPQDPAPSSANPSSNPSLAESPADVIILPGQDATNLALHSTLYRHSPTFTPNGDPFLGYLGHPLQDRPLQRLTTYDGISQASFQSVKDPMKHGNFTAQATSRPSKYEKDRQMKPDGVYRHGEVALLKGHEKNDTPDWSAVGHECDRHELFLFGNDEPCNTVPDGTDKKGLGHTRAGSSDQIFLRERTSQSEKSKLISTRERVPTPGLSRILGPSPKNKVIQYRSNKPITLQEHGPSTAEEGTRPRKKSTQYYDYSEDFENSTALPLHMSTCHTLVPGPGSVKPYGVERYRVDAQGDFNSGSQAGHGYSQARICDDQFPYADAASGYAFPNPAHQGGCKWTEQGRRAHALQGAPYPPSYPQHPRVPLQEYAYAEPYGAYPQVPRGPIRLQQHRNRGHDVRVYPYSQSYQGGYQGGSGCNRGRGNARRYSGDGHNASRYHGQYRDSGQRDRRFCNAGRYHRSYGIFKGHYSNEENMPPAAQGQGRCEPRHGIMQTHRRVQNMMKSLIPRGLGQGNRANDRPAIRISRPIPILAPRPVSSNIGLRLTENVLSIDDDDMLPAGLRNLQDGSSGPSDDEFPEFEPTPTGQNEPILGQNNNSRLHFQVPRKATAPAKKELRRPRLIARVDSTKASSSNAQIYASPRNVDIQETVVSRARTPYPAETLTELEFQGIIRTKLKSDPDEESRSITKPENDRWESTKAILESAKEDVMAKLGIKTKRVREAEKLGYTPLTRQAKASIPNSGPQDEAFDNKLDQRRQKIEQWRRRTSVENDEAGDPRTDAEEKRIRNANGHRPNMTTAAGHAIACPSMKERLMHLKAKAFRSKPNLRERM